MKKFSKILTFILSLVLIVTAFTVIALAADTSELQPVVKYDKNYDDMTLGTKQESSASGYGYFGVSAQEGSFDKYILHFNEDIQPDGKNTSYLSGFYTYGSTATNLSEYPYAVFEFDIMKLTSSYSKFSIGTYIKSAKGKSGVYPSISSADLTKYLPGEKHEWARVTLVFTYHTEIVEGVTNGYCGYVLYVNGEEKLENLNLKSFAYTDGIYNESPEKDWFFTDLRVDSPSKNVLSYESALDNVKLTMYPKGSDINEIVKNSYSEGYDFPYTKTRALVGEVGYDNIQEAFDAAKDGDTVYLREDVTDTILINKAITVEAGDYAFNYKSFTGYVAEVTDTTYAFSLSDQLATVKWDSCEGECDCYFKDKVGHVLTNETKVPLGELPQSLTENVTFETVDGFEILFLGWSYTKGATEPDTIEAIDADDVANGLSLYPVYKMTQYAIEVRKGDDVKYYLESEFATAFAEAASGSTIKLMTDVETPAALTVKTASLTLDLNGKALNRVYYYGNHYLATYDEETNTYDYGTAATYMDATKGSDFLFTVNGSVTLSVTSSVEGASLLVSNIGANTWYYEDKIVKREILGYDDGRVFYTLGSSMNLSLSNVDVYATSVVYSNNGNQTNNTINVNNVNFFQMKPNYGGSNSYFIYMYAKVNVTMNFTDSQFYFPVNGSFFYSTNASSSGSACVTTFTNCDIIKDSSTSNGLGNNFKKTAEECIFDNCRLYDLNAITCGLKNGSLQYVGSGTSERTAAAGYENVTLENAVKIKYYVTHKNAFETADTTALIQSIQLSYPQTKEVTLTFNTVSAKPVTVNWMNGEEVYKTTKTAIYPGVDNIDIPKLTKELKDDLYRDILFQWVDANNNLAANVLSSNIDWEIDTYTFNAAESVGGVTKYAPVLKDAQLSISYVSQFWQHFYLPVVEGMERPTITGFEPDSSSATVIINRQKYYLYTFWENASAILNTSTINVNYTIDGVDYVAKVDISGLIYADIILSNQTYYAAEAESVANMVRYAYECYAIKSQTDSSVAANLEKYSAKITELIGTFAADGSTTGGKYNLNAYTTSFGEVAESDIENYGEYIHSMAYGIFGTSGRTMVILTKEATDAGVKIFFNGSEGRKDTTTIKNSETGEDETVNVYYVDNQKVYDAIGKITVTIKAPDKEDINTSYSLPQYITAITEKLPEENINVAKAMYDFGVAAKAYVNGLSDY